MKKVLNVAEKPSIARTISSMLSHGPYTIRPGVSKYNSCFDFRSTLSLDTKAPTVHNMVMTSVSGHLLNFAFKAPYTVKNWRAFDPLVLLRAPVSQVISGSSNSAEDIEKTLQREAKDADALIIWTDCDREGEAIGLEIVKVCQRVNPNILVKRAQFSAASKTEIGKALLNLKELDINQCDAVLARAEIDLRLGSAFTRMQTLELGSRYQDLKKSILSFGPCQFPTLGLVVDRHILQQSFIPEPFWCIDLHLKESKFTWSRSRVIDFAVASSLYEEMASNIQKKGVTIKKVEDNKPFKIFKPEPLNTVALQVACSSWLKIDSSTAMAAMEKLYQNGIISYPRTDTTQFPLDGSIDPVKITLDLVDGSQGRWAWEGALYSFIANKKLSPPHNTKVTDNAHPPIYPLKYVTPESITDENQRHIYEFIVRHHIASTSLDASGISHTVEAEAGEETFSITGRNILESNFLDIYPYKKKPSSSIPSFMTGEILLLSEIKHELRESKTTPPELLTEEALIKLMVKYGIGTDATLQDHIKTILDRKYCDKLKKGKNDYFSPTKLGYSLIMGYKELNHEDSISKPFLRAEMESDLKQIVSGTLTRREYVERYVSRFTKIYKDIVLNLNTFRKVLDTHYGSAVSGNGTNATTKIADNVFCNCQAHARQLTVTKEGPNNGRLFYLCAARKCNFFQWHVNENQMQTASSSAGMNKTSVTSIGVKTHTPPIENKATISPIDNKTTDVAVEKKNPNQVNVLPRQQQGESMDISTVVDFVPSPEFGQNPSCKCGKASHLRVVQKDNQNKGREFYTCSTRECNYFQWADEPLAQKDKISQPQTSSPNPFCYCVEPIRAVKFRVSKEGPNRGREFLSCSRKKCNYFQWADEYKAPIVIKESKTAENAPNGEESTVVSQQPVDAVASPQIVDTNGTNTISTNASTSINESQIEVAPLKIRKKLTKRKQINLSPIGEVHSMQEKMSPEVSKVSNDIHYQEILEEQLNSMGSSSHSSHTHRSFQSMLPHQNAENSFIPSLGATELNLQSRDICSCKMEPIVLTISKTGRNFGRQFYSCPVKRCNYFKWKA